MADEPKDIETAGIRTGSLEREGFFKEIDIAFLAHELKDPLSVIEAGVRTLLERPDHSNPLSERQERILKRTLINSHKIRSLINELLEIGRGEAGCFVRTLFKPVNAVLIALTDAVETFSLEMADSLPLDRSPEQIITLLQRENIFFDATPEAIAVQLLQDERKFLHITGNLIKNALYYRTKRVDIQVNLDSQWLILEVRDDGSGVPPSFQNQIFQCYSQAVPSSGMLRNGHGLGLAGARVLARCLGGDIILSSSQETGAAFKFMMPISE